MTKKQFDLNFIREQNKLLKSASFLSNDGDLARDLVQKTYCLGLEKISLYKERGLFFSWMNKLMKNIHFSECKVNKKHKTILESVFSEENSLKILDYRYLADANIFIKSRRERLKLALNNIPLKYKRALKLNVEDNLSYKQIALQEKIKYGTVKSRISRAKMLLKKSIDLSFEKEGDGHKVDKS